MTKAKWINIMEAKAFSKAIQPHKSKKLSETVVLEQSQYLYYNYNIPQIKLLNNGPKDDICISKSNN